MAKRCKPLIAGWLLPGVIASGLLIIIALSAFGALWFNAPDSNWYEFLHDSYLWHVIQFTFWQAFFICPLIGNTRNISGKSTSPPPFSRQSTLSAFMRHDVDPACFSRSVRHPDCLWANRLAGKYVPVVGH